MGSGTPHGLHMNDCGVPKIWGKRRASIELPKTSSWTGLIVICLSSRDPSTLRSPPPRACPLSPCFDYCNQSGRALSSFAHLVLDCPHCRRECETGGRRQREGEGEGGGGKACGVGRQETLARLLGRAPHVATCYGPNLGVGTPRSNLQSASNTRGRFPSCQCKVG